MALEFKFPDVGEGITEGTIVKWRVKEGDSVNADQVIADVETDKAIVEIPSPKKGTILKLYHKEGEVIPVHDVLAVIGEKGEKIPARKELGQAAHYTGSVVGFLPEAEEEEKKITVRKKASSDAPQARIMASPLVRKLANVLNVNLINIKGTGPNGIITENDVKNAVSGKKAESKPESTPEKTGFKKTKKYDFYGYVDHVQIKGIRKITAQRMRDAVANAALVTNHDDVDVTNLAELRNKEKEKAAKQKVNLTYLPFIVKAVIQAIKKHPFVASSVEEDEIIVK